MIRLSLAVTKVNGMIIPSVEQLELTWKEGRQMLLRLSNPLLLRV
jgi:hypothetical protein